MLRCSGSLAQLVRGGVRHSRVRFSSPHTPPRTVLPSALWSHGRWVHTPPGGFEQELPPSFGRSGGKGEPSNINSLSAKKRILKMKKNRKKLDRVAAAAASAEKVKADLQALIKKNAAYTGRRHPAEEKIHLVGGGDEAFFNDRIQGYFDRADAARVANQSARDGWMSTGGEGATRQHEGNATASTVLDDVIGESDSRRLEAGERAASAAAFQCVDAFPLPVEQGDQGRNSALTPLPSEEDRWRGEQSLERKFAVTPGSTVFGSDLDRLERDMLREYDQRGASLPPLDAVYRRYGGGRQGRRMQWEPSSSFDHMPSSDFDGNRASEALLGDEKNRNLSAYHMSAEAHRERHSYAARAAKVVQESALPRGQKGINLIKQSGKLTGAHRDDGSGDSQTGRLLVTTAAEPDLPASANPHFPEEREEKGSASRIEDTSDEGLYPQHSPLEGKMIVVNAKTDYRADLTTVRGEDDSFPYDAYNQRPAEEGMVELRGVDYWSSYENREKIERGAQYRRDRFELEKLAEGALDTSEVEHSTNRVRRETFLYFQNYPINEMIQEPFVRIREIVPKGGGDKIVLNRVEPHDLSVARSPGERDALETLNTDADIPLQEARRMAQNLGLDLIRIGSLNTQKSDRRVIALCQIGDHREHLRDMIKFKIQKLGVQPPPTRECIEVTFRGGTHPHAIRFKAVGIAKHLLHRHAIRVNLTKFGTPREGFPVLQTILDEVKRQCLQLKAYHKAGEIQANYDEIYCYLYPSTGRSPKTTVDHPTPQRVREARDFRVLENEKEVYFDDLHNQITQRERLAYLTKLDKGTAWADKDEGMSLQRQRAIKVMLGYLPKGNKELYAARGDVNVPAPFRSSHMTSTDRWGNPVESNLEQASRGAATIGKRAAMPVSEMHDKGETSENPTQLDRFYYRVQGPALELGEFKEALGLKHNRKKRPPLGPGYGTIGVGEHPGFENGSAAK